MKCKNIYCERQDDIQPTGCRIYGCNPKVCVLNERFKQLQNTSSSCNYTKCAKEIIDICYDGYGSSDEIEKVLLEYFG